MFADSDDWPRNPDPVSEEEKARRRLKHEEREKERARQVEGDSIGILLWRVRFELEGRREPGDESLVWLGELANILEEADADTVDQLRELVEQAWQYAELTV